MILWLARLIWRREQLRVDEETPAQTITRMQQAAVLAEEQRPYRTETTVRVSQELARYMERGTR